MINEWVLKMQEAKTAKERKKIVEEYSRIIGRSVSFCYKELKKNGYDSKRAKRKDIGKKNIDDNTIKIVASLVKTGIRENGKKTMPVNVALDMLKRNGYDINIKTSRMREILKDSKIDADRLKKDSHNIRLRSEYPNQVHQVDPSVALIYFAPESEDGKSKMKIIEDSEYYKNKDFFNDAKDKKGKKIRRKKCLRYVLTDHYSGSICLRYYAAYGETAEYLYDFLLYAWSKKEREDYAFHGVPEILVWDKGSANTSKSVANALRSLKVKTIAHSTGNSRAKGQVENANNLIETHFECLFRLEAISSIEELNEAAERFCVEYNTKMKIKRMGQIINSRYLLWQKITLEQLRELPDIEVCKQIFSAGVLKRKVKSDLTISMYHAKAKRTLYYSLINLGVEKGDEINAQAVLFGDKYKAIIWFNRKNEYGKSEELSYEIEPIEIDEAGFDINAAVIGKEYKQTKLTENENDIKEIENISEEIKKQEILKSHSLIQPDIKFIYQKEGEKINLDKNDNDDCPPAAREILLSYVEVMEKVKSGLGYVPDDLAEELKKDYTDGIPYSYADEIISFWKNKENKENENII